MIPLAIPGWKDLDITQCMFDFNGTLALDGRISNEVEEGLVSLAETAKVSILTADIHGTVTKELAHLPLEIVIVSGPDEAAAKQRVLLESGADNTIFIGNGANDLRAMELAALSIAVISSEGCNSEALKASDIVVTSPIDALGLLLNPSRIIATMRR